MDISQFKIRSIGYVAEPLDRSKDVNMRIIEVYAAEMNPFTDGIILPNATEHTYEGEDAEGKKFKVKAQSTSTIGAEWLPFGVDNRKTAPDVMRGEQIVIWQFGDHDKYWWTTTGQSEHLRRLETVIWGIAANPNEKLAKLTLDDMYYMEFSSHTKRITLKTSRKNGEVVAYTMQWDLGEGSFEFQDDLGQSWSWDSIARAFQFKNADGSFIRMVKKVIDIVTGDIVNIKTETMNVDVTTLNMTGKKLNITFDEIVVKGTSWKSTIPLWEHTGPQVKFIGSTVGVGVLLTTPALALGVPIGGSPAGAPMSGNASGLTINIPVIHTGAYAGTGTYTFNGLVINNGINIGSTHMHNETGLGGGVTTPPL